MVSFHVFSSSPAPKMVPCLCHLLVLDQESSLWGEEASLSARQPPDPLCSDWPGVIDVHLTPPGLMEVCAVTDCWSETLTIFFWSGLRASASPAALLAPLHALLLSCGLRELLTPCEGGGPRAHLLATYLCQGCLTPVQAGCGTEPCARLPEEANLCLDILCSSHCLPGFSPAAGSRTYVSGCVFLLASSSFTVLLP